MTTETFLTFWHTHINSIIGVLVTLVLVLLVIYLLIEFFKEKQGPLTKTAAKSAEEEAAPVAASIAAPVDFSQIEESLKKLIENSNLAAAASAAAKSSPVSTGAESADVEALKRALSEKDDLIKKMKESIVDSKGEDKGEAVLEAKVKDLEARLTEYEIIEDDIADLSMYKEENARLKGELEAFKTPAPAGKAAKVEAPVPPPPAPVVEAEPVDASAAMLGLEDLTGATSADTNKVVEFESVDPELADDIMAEFAAAVKEQRVADSVKPIEKAEVTAPTGKGAAISEEKSEESEGGWDVGGINTDKMLGEIDDLNASSDPDDGTSALEVTEVDTDKMLLETTALNPKDSV